MKSSKEIEVMLGESASKRYTYAIKRIADNNVLWIIGDEEGIGTYADGNGQIIFPIWPSEEFASKCCEGEYLNYIPEEVEVGVFVDNYLQSIVDDNGKVAVFPVPSGMGVIVDPGKIKEDLEEELSKY